MQAFQNWWYGVRYVQGISVNIKDGIQTGVILQLNGGSISFKKGPYSEHKFLLDVAESLLRRKISHEEGAGGTGVYYKPVLNCLEFPPANRILETSTVLYLYLDQNLTSALRDHLKYSEMEENVLSSYQGEIIKEIDRDQ